MKHVAIIMDGNGRWATERGLSRSRGHVAGARAARAIIEAAVSEHVERLTLFAFSTENWKRPWGEVRNIMRLLKTFCVSFEPLFHKHRVRFDFIGDETGLPSVYLRGMRDRTAMYEGTCVTLAVNYSGRQDILRAASECRGDASVFECGLAVGDVDLLIRTGGERRLSNFLLWQAAYAELSFSDRMWPEYSPADFRAALREFRLRERRFGGLGGSLSARA